MKLLLDTHLLLWAAYVPGRLSTRALEMIEADDAELMFSAVSIWEVAIKHGRQKPDFTAEPAMFRRGLLDSGYTELPITGPQAIGVATLPGHHKDPFDRLLLAQAQHEGILLLTSDAALAQYGGLVRLV